ncbi:MAG: peptidoglycan-binding domain-containing protein [Gemmatimonadota bacterium]
MKRQRQARAEGPAGRSAGGAVASAAEGPVARIAAGRVGRITGRAAGRIAGFPVRGAATLGLALATGVWAGLGASPAAAQELVSPASLRARAGGPAAVRVVEHFDPESGARAREVMQPLTAREILGVQEALRRAGYAFPEWPEAPGRLGEGTRDALRRFQRDRELEPCGCPSYETVVALGLVPRVVMTVVRSTSGESAARRALEEEGEEGPPPVEVIYPRSPPPESAPGPGSRSENEAGGGAGSRLHLFPAHGHFGLFGHHLLHLPGTDGVLLPGAAPPGRRGVPLGRRSPFFGRPGPPSGRPAPPNRFVIRPSSGRRP